MSTAALHEELRSNPSELLDAGIPAALPAASAARRPGNSSRATFACAVVRDGVPQCSRISFVIPKTQIGHVPSRGMLCGEVLAFGRTAGPARENRQSVRRGYRVRRAGIGLECVAEQSPGEQVDRYDAARLRRCRRHGPHSGGRHWPRGPKSAASGARHTVLHGRVSGPRPDGWPRKRGSATSSPESAIRSGRRPFRQARATG